MKKHNIKHKAFTEDQGDTNEQNVEKLPEV